MIDVPFERQVWDAEIIGNYWGCKPTYVLQRLRYSDNFPQPVPERFYSDNGKRNKLPPRWRADEIIKWARGE